MQLLLCCFFLKIEMWRLYCHVLLDTWKIGTNGTNYVGYFHGTRLRYQRAFHKNKGKILDQVSWFLKLIF